MGNTQTATSFMQMVTAGNIQQAYDEYVSDNFIHHNIYYPGDREALLTAMIENHEQFPGKILDIKRTISENDLVMVHSLIKLDTEHDGVAAVHIFRFENDQIAELWDMTQAIDLDSPNENGLI
ncbi:MAG TPA: polyketide cyclase [Planctomycetaceae bacterium]|nr:polyketide cyclase [Planctomycetaceae bacterium]